mgnify:CR=1 FL=1
MAKRKPKMIPTMTLQQPYCWLVMEGHVTSERRVGTPPQYGPVAIIAGKKSNQVRDPHHARVQRDYPDCPDADDLEHSAIVGVVDVVDCLKSDKPGMPYVWKLRKPRRLKKPKPYAGAGGMIEIEATCVARSRSCRRTVRN